MVPTCEYDVVADRKLRDGYVASYKRKDQAIMCEIDV